MNQVEAELVAKEIIKYIIEQQPRNYTSSHNVKICEVGFGEETTNALCNAANNSLNKFRINFFVIDKTEKPVPEYIKFIKTDIINYDYRSVEAIVSLDFHEKISQFDITKLLINAGGCDVKRVITSPCVEESLYYKLVKEEVIRGKTLCFYEL
ncbi:hypothetical protein GF352_02165 [archaeon]|nr:hypothetical protein [archaeon]